MARTVGEAWIGLEARIQKYMSNLDKAEGRLKGFSQRVAHYGAKFAKFGAVAGAAVAGLSIALGRKAVKAAADAERANMMLASNLRNVATASEGGADALIRYADRLQKLTGYDDEQIKMGMAMLATYQLNEKQIEAAIPRVLDMAAAIEKLSGQEADLQQMALLVGKGLVGQLGALSRYGVMIDDETMKTKDFNGILLALDRNYKGSAETLGKTYVGAVRKFHTAIGDLLELVGIQLLPMVRQWATQLTAWLKTEDAERWAEDFGQSLKTLGETAAWAARQVAHLLSLGAPEKSRKLMEMARARVLRGWVKKEYPGAWEEALATTARARTRLEKLTIPKFVISPEFVVPNLPAEILEQFKSSPEGQAFKDYWESYTGAELPAELLTSAERAQRMLDAAITGFRPLEDTARETKGVAEALRDANETGIEAGEAIAEAAAKVEDAFGGGRKVADALYRPIREARLPQIGFVPGETPSERRERIAAEREGYREAVQERREALKVQQRLAMAGVTPGTMMFPGVPTPTARAFPSGMIETWRPPEIARHVERAAAAEERETVAVVQGMQKFFEHANQTYGFMQNFGLALKALQEQQEELRNELRNL